MGGAYAGGIRLKRHSCDGFEYFAAGDFLFGRCSHGLNFNLEDQSLSRQWMIGVEVGNVIPDLGDREADFLAVLVPAHDVATNADVLARREFPQPTKSSATSSRAA